VTSARAIFWTVPTSFLAGRGAAGGLAFISTIGSLGGFAGPFVMGWIRQETGSFIFGLHALAAVLTITTVLAAALRLFVWNEWPYC
jgi:nitrate/nitrite transporter NarK